MKALIEKIDEILDNLEQIGKAEAVMSESWKIAGSCHTMVRKIKQLAIQEQERIIKELDNMDDEGMIHRMDTIISIVKGE